MAKYLFIYHGGEHPETEAEVKEVLDAWGAWMGSMGAAVIDGGNPVGMSSTINADGSVSDNGGSNPASGYGLFEASDLDDAAHPNHPPARKAPRTNGRYNSWPSLPSQHPLRRSWDSETTCSSRLPGVCVRVASTLEVPEFG